MSENTPHAAQGSVEVALRTLDSMDARFLWLVYHDFSGLARLKVVPRARIADALVSGASYNKINWDADINGAVVSEFNYGADSGDFKVVPDLDTLVGIPYRDGVAQVYGYLHDAHGEWAGDPRRALRVQAEALRREGLDVQVGLEAELLLMDAFAEPRGAAGVQMFSLSEIDVRWEYWADVMDTLEAMGVPVHQVGREFGGAQHEISLMPDDPVASVDDMLTTRQVVKALASDRGWLASFMPKPWPDRPGNGLHVHLSFTGADGRDVLTDHAHPTGMTPLGQHILAGLLRHSPASSRWDPRRGTRTGACGRGPGRPRTSPGGSATGPYSCASRAARRLRFGSNTAPPTSRPTCTSM